MQHHRSVGLVTGTLRLVAQGLGAAHRFAQRCVGGQRRHGQPGQCRKQAASTMKVRWATALLHADILPTKRLTGHQYGAGRESVQVSLQRRQAARQRTVMAGS